VTCCRRGCTADTGPDTVLHNFIRYSDGAKRDTEGASAAWVCRELSVEPGDVLTRLLYADGVMLEDPNVTGSATQLIASDGAVQTALRVLPQGL